MGKILDGIIDEDKYKKSPIKILWVLKEGNVAEGDKNKQRDIREEFREDGHKKNALSIPTFRKMIYATYGILHSDKDWSDVPFANEEAYEVVKQIAYININKYPAAATSNYNDIKKAYNDNKLELLKQISRIDPDVIVFGNTLYYFDFEDLGEIGWTITDRKYADEKTKYTAFYEISSSKLCINAYHPAYTKISNEVYWDEIRKAYRIWKKL
jgi:hypothetical protein